MTKDNYESWQKGILTHCRWLNILPRLYGLICELNKYWKNRVWSNKNDHIIGLFCCGIFREAYYQILGIRCSHTVSTKIWDIFGDPHIPQFPYDPSSNCLILLDNVDNISFDDDVLEEFEYDVKTEHLDDPKTSPIAHTFPIEIAHSPSTDNSLRTSIESSQ